MNLFKRKKSMLALANAAMDEAIDRTKSNFRELSKSRPEGTELTDELTTLMMEFAAYKTAVHMSSEGSGLSTSVDVLAQSIFNLCASDIKTMEIENN
jgi:hypothetical protein